MKKLEQIKPICIFSLIVVFFFSSCGKEEIPKSNLIIKDNIIYERGSDVPFTGREKARTENKIIEYDVKDGLKHGVFLLYSLDGTLEVKGQIDSNRNVGKWQYFYSTGEIESEGNFDNDLPEGCWIYYFPDGKKREEGNFTKGKRTGIWYQYNEEGEVILEKNFDIDDTPVQQTDTTSTEV
jgi:antitoxin component YwqK of YwqJK toxin-antitoxin module